MPTCYHLFLLFRMFSYLVTKQQNLRLVQIQSICRQQNKCYKKMEIWSGMGGKH